MVAAHRFTARDCALALADHDPAHAIFATTGAYVDYALGSDTPGAGSPGKLSPLMAALYRVLYPTGDGVHAADELCYSGESAPGAGLPWVALRVSRLITKHESEWANPTKWQELVRAIEQRTGPKPEHEEEEKRIAMLAWWDELQAGVAGFPGPDVYHINPVGLVGNLFWRQPGYSDRLGRFNMIAPILGLETE